MEFLAALMSNPEEFSASTLTHLADAAYWQQFRKSAEEVEGQLLLLRDRIGDDIEIAPGIRAQPGRITRGQNYHGFPYRVLDHPATFQSGGFVLFRTILIWGHHLSFHLIAQGEWKQQLQNQLSGLPAPLTQWLFVMDSNPWEWFPNAGTARPFQDISTEACEDRLKKADFIKFSCYHPIEKGLNLVDSGHRYWRIWAPWVAGTDVD